MKIYNEIITQFNDLTGQWDTLYEDSEDYNGPMAFMQGGIPPNASPINTSDTIADTIKTTAGYFTGGDGTLRGWDIYSGSLTTSNVEYYHNVQQTTASTAATQFSITFGHVQGSGSDTHGDSSTNPKTLKGETEAIYRQLSTLLMDETEASGGFKITQQGADRPAWISAGERDSFIWALVGKRERFKDRINKKAWTMTLSASNFDNSAGITVSLTDDSKYVAAVATPGGPRHNIVSGTLGVPSGSAGEGDADAYKEKTFGWFYPEMGMMVFAGEQMSASLPGDVTGHKIQNYTASYVDGYTTANKKIRESGSGFTPTLDNNGNTEDNPIGNSIKLLNCMQKMKAGTTFRLRSEEDQTQENYFCRIRAEQYNFSANPSFTSGSKNKIRNTDMHGNPQTFITGVGLYNSAGQLLAIAKLSSPLKKNFASEATVKVKLTY